MSDVLAVISDAAYNWLLGYTKKVQKRHPGAYFGYSEEYKAWQIFSADNKLWISIGISIKTIVAHVFYAICHRKIFRISPR